MGEDFDNHCGGFDGGYECDRVPTVGTECHEELKNV